MTHQRARSIGLWSVLSALVAAAVPATARGEGDTARFSTILLVRHAEKAGPTGNVPLNPAGRQRAQRLASMLRDAEIREIFTTDLTRTQETAAPLAARAKITPRVFTAISLDPLVARLRVLPAGTVALVVHHSNTLPDLVQKLGGPRVPEFADDEYDRLLVLTRSPEGMTRLVTLRY
jgi:broad specificity phosphatase PhoE